MDGGKKALAIIVLVLTCGCSPRENATLVVDLQTDFALGAELHTLEITTIRGPEGISLRETPTGTDGLRGIRVAEVDDVESGLYHLAVIASRPNGSLLVRTEILIEARGTTPLRVLLTRSCEDHRCPLESPDQSACVGGSCEDPRCIGGDETACTAAPECSTASDCAGPSPTCGRLDCVNGWCVVDTSSAECEEGSYCDPDEGCRPIPIVSTPRGEVVTDNELEPLDLVALPVEPWAVVLADLDVDEDLDSVVIVGLDVVSLLGAGDGTLRSTATLPGTSRRGSPAVGDLDEDGIPELVVGRPDDHRIDIHRGNGDGTFQPATENPTGVETYPFDARLVDLDRDGHLDVVTTFDARDAFAGALLGNGDGTLGPVIRGGANYGVWSGSYGLAVEDLDRDGHLDVAASVYWGWEGCNECGFGVGVLLGKGDGTFELPRTTDTGMDSFEIVQGDFDRDGLGDVAHGPGVLLGDGDGFLTPSWMVATGEFVSTADLSDDDHLDLVHLDEDAGTLGIAFGRGDGTFTEPSAVDLPFEAIYATTGDMNGDGRADLVVTGRNPNGILVLLVNPSAE